MVLEKELDDVLKKGEEADDETTAKDANEAANAVEEDIADLEEEIEAVKQKVDGTETKKWSRLSMQQWILFPFPRILAHSHLQTFVNTQ